MSVAEVLPGTSQKPGAHAVHDDAPARLYVLTGHAVPVVIKAVLAANCETVPTATIKLVVPVFHVRVQMVAHEEALADSWNVLTFGLQTKNGFA